MCCIFVYIPYTREDMEVKEIEALATMARIALTPEEVASMQERVGAVLDYVSQVQEIAANEEKKIGIVHNVMREDVLTRVPNQYTNAVLANAPSTKGRFVEVQKVIDIE